MLIVAALGGNAVTRPGTEGNIAQQFAAAAAAVRPVADLLLAGHHIVLTHGNGPQVGQVMRRVEIAAQFHIYPLPLDTAVADTQAGMGYMICQCLMNELNRRGNPRLCTTVITTVRVDADDPAFAHPDKPVGPFMTHTAAEKHARDDGWKIVEDPSRRKWRRVVPSPLPREIIELPLLKTLIDSHYLIVAAGGGGIPVTHDEAGNYRGVEAVIDKDRTSAILAAELSADMLAILTNVDQVQKDHGKPGAKPLDKITLTHAQALMRQGEFTPGSMLPKIHAAIDFLQQSRGRRVEVLITSCERFADAFAGKTGTRIVPDEA